MATTKIMIVIAKYTVKANGAVIYRMRSNIANKLGAIESCDQVERNGKFYDVYMVTSDGEYVCSCETSGETCKGSMYRGTCCHRKHVQMLLDAAKDAKVVEPEVVVIEVAEEAVAPAEPIEAPVVEAVVANSSEGIASAVKSVELPEEACHEAPKPTYRIITVPGAKKERYDLLADIEAKREHKSDMLGEINEIKSRKRSEDCMMKAPLTQNRAFSILR